MGVSWLLSDRLRSGAVVVPVVKRVAVRESAGLLFHSVAVMEVGGREYV